VKIETQRLVLRPPALADAARVSLLAGDYAVASMTGTIPHPYSEQEAAAWLAEAIAGEEGVVFMIDHASKLIGCTGYRAFGEDYAELGYWIGRPYWNQGCATEAVRALITHAFDADGFDYLKAGHFADNPASERVIAKLGFERHGDEVRDCVARGGTTDCRTYRLDRARARAMLRSA
jgi:RimJ/RimL family protein N-acetyltransferase